VSILEFWRYSSLNIMKLVATALISAPVTSVSGESAFSIAGAISRHRRAVLTGEMLMKC